MVAGACARDGVCHSVVDRRIFAAGTRRRAETAVASANWHHLSRNGDRDFDLVGLSLYPRAALRLGAWTARALLLCGECGEDQSRIARDQRRLYGRRVDNFLVEAGHA